MIMPTNLWDIQTSLRALYTLCVEPVCQSYGVTRTELDILLFLANNPKSDTAAEISDLRYLAKSHVSTSLKSLEANGYIVKSAGEDDRRQVHLKLTENASAAVRDGKEHQAAFADIILAGLGKEERRQLQACIARMEQNIENYLEEHAK